MSNRPILAYLDEYMDISKWHSPPSLGSREWAATRLTVFRGRSQWIILFEIVHYDEDINRSCIDIWAYSDSLTEQGNILFDYRRFPYEFIESDMTPNLAPGVWLDRAHFSVLMNGKQFDFSPSQEEYVLAGVIFSEAEVGPGSLTEAQLLRFLCYKLDQPFFASEDFMRHIIDVYSLDRIRLLSHQVELFLQTREWRHPNLTSPDAERWPSRVSSFQVLARAIESGDLDEWAQQDRATFNTVWSNSWRLWSDDF